MNIEKAIKLDSSLGAAHVGLGLVHICQNNYSEDLLYLKKALELQAELDHVLYNVAVVHLEDESKKMALYYFKKFDRIPSSESYLLRKKKNWRSIF